MCTDSMVVESVRRQEEERMGRGMEEFEKTTDSVVIRVKECGLSLQVLMQFGWPSRQNQKGSVPDDEFFAKATVSMARDISAIGTPLLGTATSDNYITKWASNCLHGVELSHNLSINGAYAHFFVRQFNGE
jgi:hypothetical protein